MPDFGTIVSIDWDACSGIVILNDSVFIFRFRDRRRIQSVSRDGTIDWSGWTPVSDDLKSGDKIVFDVSEFGCVGVWTHVSEWDGAVNRLPQPIVVHDVQLDPVVSGHGRI